MPVHSPCQRAEHPERLLDASLEVGHVVDRLGVDVAVGLLDDPLNLLVDFIEGLYTMR